MSYNINPCKACWKKHKAGECNINTMNDCVVETATAFSNFPSNNSLRDNKFDINWHDCMENIMQGMPKVAGEHVNFSTLQLNMAPRWVQVPHHFPERLVQTNDKDKALKMCVMDCEEGRKLVKECILTCKTDYNAVESVPEKKSISKSSAVSRGKKKHQHSKNGHTRADRAMISVIILFILVSAVVMVYLSTK